MIVTTGSLWTRPAVVTDGVSDVALSVRYPEGTLIRVAVPHGLSPAGYAEVMPAGFDVEGVVESVQRRSARLAL